MFGSCVDLALRSLKRNKMLTGLNLIRLKRADRQPLMSGGNVAVAPAP